MLFELAVSQSSDEVLRLGFTWASNGIHFILFASRSAVGPGCDYYFIGGCCLKFNSVVINFNF